MEEFRNINISPLNSPMSFIANTAGANKGIDKANWTTVLIDISILLWSSRPG